MSEPTLYNALKDIADAIRAKGITGTMSALEMPDKIASIVTGGGDKYDITLDGLIGDVDEQGVLQAPSETFTFTSNEIVEVPDDTLDSFFSARDTITAVSLPNLTTVGEYGMKEICRDCEYLTSANLASLTSIDEHGMEKAFQNCLSLTTLNLSSLSTVGDYGLSYAFASTYLNGDLDFSTITSIGSHGLEGLFQNCDHITGVDLSGLTTIPAYGLAYAFDDCGSLVAADLSNVTTIGEGGMKSAFIESSIESLSMPSLTTVGDNGLESAFFNCDSLTTLDLSGVTSIGANGIKKMCTGCALLATVDMSSVETLNGLDYLEAFDQCPSLQEVDISGIETIDFLDATSVPTLTSTILFANTNNYYKIVVPDALYTDWIVANYWSDPTVLPHIISESAFNALTFTATQANSTVKLKRVGNPPSCSFEYSIDNGQNWGDLSIGTSYTLSNIGDSISIRAKTPQNTLSSNGYDNCHRFETSGGLKMRGSLHALLTKDWNTTPITMGQHALETVCQEMAAETDISELLPLDWPQNYQNYRGIFWHANVVGEVPRNLLPATTVGNSAYLGFFENTHITNAPDLPATTLGGYCYADMFCGCTSLTKAPYLPATSLPTACYRELFWGCTSLNEIKIGYTGNFPGGGYPASFDRWVLDVPSGGTFYYNGSDTSNFGTSAIPSGWTVQSF